MKKATLFPRLLVSSIREKCITAYQNSSSHLSFFRLNKGQYGAHPFQNPIAYAIRDNPPQFTSEEQSIVRACSDSARLVIEKDHLTVLHNYFIETAGTDTVMGRFYSTMTFEDFVLRLFLKRYRVVFLDGHLVVAREKSDVLGKIVTKTQRSNFLSLAPYYIYRDVLLKVGTEADQEKLYEEYITLKEMMLTPLLLPQVISIMIGNGSRNPSWSALKEAESATDIAVLSSTVAPEFSDGVTLHLDLPFCVVMEPPDREMLKRIDEIKQDAPLIHAARAIYGEKLAIDFTIDEAKLNQSGDFVCFEVSEQHLWLYKPAYFARLKTLLKTLLLSSDEAMQRAGVGTVFNLKGLGLGAFGFSSVKNQAILEKLYIKAVDEVLGEISANFQHITIVNLINLPSDRQNKTSGVEPRQIAQHGSVQLIRSVMNPTDKTIPTGEAEVGGTHLCGDSGAKVGNEGLIGASRDTSDDPAGIYSKMNPIILDPSANTTLQSTDCIYILDTQTNRLLPFKNSDFDHNVVINKEKKPITHKFD